MYQKETALNDIEARIRSYGAIDAETPEPIMRAARLDLPHNPLNAPRYAPEPTTNTPQRSGETVNPITGRHQQQYRVTADGRFEAVMDDGASGNGGNSGNGGGNSGNGGNSGGNEEDWTQEGRPDPPSGGLGSYFRYGWKTQGWKNPNIDPSRLDRGGRERRYARSILTDTIRGRHPVVDGGIPEQAAVLAGRIARDLTGLGTVSLTWNMHPMDIASTVARQAGERMGVPLGMAQLAGVAAGLGLSVGSGNFNPTNFEEGGRATGFRSLNPDPLDPTQSTSPVVEYGLDRLFFGRTGYLLPYEQFHKERPDVSYQEYVDYQDYLKDKGLLGLVKADPDGIDGPEARILGYRVTPTGIAAAALAGGSVLAGTKFFRRKR